MKDDLLALFESLLDVEYQEHIIEVMRQWCYSKRANLNKEHANLVQEEIFEPLMAWVENERTTSKSRNNPDIDAALDFAQKADNIIYILRYNTRQLYSEHVSILNDAWSYFQRSVAHRFYVRSRILREYFSEAGPTAADQSNVDEKIQVKEAQAETEKKQNFRARCAKWQKAGVKAATKYPKQDKNKWVTEAKKILNNTPRRISARQLATDIATKFGYPNSAIDTIRKYRPIINILNEHPFN